MMSVLAAWFGPRLGKAGLVLLGVAGLLLVAALLAWLAIGTVRDLVDDAATTAKAERDAFWRAKIAEAERSAAERVAEQLRFSQALDRKLLDASAGVQTQLDELEKQNAALLADGRCGIDRDRVRLLNR